MSKIESAYWKLDEDAAILGRCGDSPEILGVSYSGETCPDFFMLNDGNFIVIGENVTKRFISQLPNDAGCGVHEAIVAVPAKTIESAVRFLSKPQ